MAAIVTIQIQKIEKVRFCAHLPKQKTWRLSADDQALFLKEMHCYYY